MVPPKMNKKDRALAAYVDTALLAENVTDLQSAAEVAVEADADPLGTTDVTALSAPVPAAIAEAAPTTPSSAGYVQAESTAIADAAIELQTVVEAIRVENVDLRARIDELTVAVASLVASNTQLIALTNELKTNFNALATAVDAL